MGRPCQEKVSENTLTNITIRPVYVVSTPMRPVPLRHLLYLAGELFPIVDEKGTFIPRGHKQALEYIAAAHKASEASCTMCGCMYVSRCSTWTRSWRWP